MERTSYVDTKLSNSVKLFELSSFFNDQFCNLFTVAENILKESCIAEFFGGKGEFSSESVLLLSEKLRNIATS